MTQQDATAVEILGEEFLIKGASPERIRALAEFVDSRFREMESAGRLQDPRRQAVLVSLNIAEEVFRERERLATEKTRTRERLDRCERILDDAVEVESE